MRTLTFLPFLKKYQMICGINEVIVIIDRNVIHYLLLAALLLQNDYHNLMRLLFF